MKKANIQYIIKTFFLISLIILLSNESSAIPAFARKYKTSCMTCHIAITKRNAFGEAFRRNGYVMPEHNARLIKEQPLKLGAEAWKEVWPDAIWPSDIPGSFPVAAYTMMRMEYNIMKSPEKNQLSFIFPNDLVLVFGGAFGEDVGFFGSWGTEYGLFKFYVRLNDLIGPKHLLNIKVGTFEPGIMDGYPGNQRLTLDYTAVQDYSAAGDWRPRKTRPGIELSGIIAHHLQYIAGVAQSQGGTELQQINNKDFYLRLAYKFGGYGLDGDGILLDSLHKNLSVDNSFTLGLFSYFGNSLKANLNESYDNKFNRFGVDARCLIGELDLLGGAIYGIDENPLADNNRLTSLVYFVEGNYMFYPWLIGVLRFEQVNSKFENNDVDKYFNIIPNITILFRQNVRFTVEGKINIQGDKNLNGFIQVADNTESFKWLKLNAVFAF
ncbi:MAG: hypothetical protein A2X61_09250 [Ignavibacteria bacterium GWB2_35_12]|nr:MAG: hypothetical protein A2X63_02875 [Ignavibacteria bacterium GWA2_35_8]OGU38164.1 MAG: hypothetical protein A2X61_09250 [Ignavibacteria bacterium GWB2_35_12]OGU94341.1 MAG: hypothetical protein A2220_14340 [Ignavibacteria bacterium RIFOXYA2_FULL_35_10]OGV20021.1 MAG: hypothetical protein A2475_02975 [Ignavibacteria bacterium RIFOXYC2_FULL_35_21]